MTATPGSTNSTGDIPPVLLRRIGETEIRVHPVALGGATFGWTLSAGETGEILDRFVDLGGNLIDTADSYASGVSEQIIGSWMRSRGRRDSVVVATKIGHGQEFPGLSSGHIRSAVDASLERLQTDYIDLLYFHGPDDDVPLVESLSAVEELISAGKVRALGASNFSPQLLLEARVASAGGLPHIEACALEYSLLHRETEVEYEAVLAAQNISLMPYFVLAHGFLGRLRDVTTPVEGDVRTRRAAKQASKASAHTLQLLDELAADLDVSVSALSLAWVLQQASVTAAAVGVDSADDLDDLMPAARLALSRLEISRLVRD